METTNITLLNPPERIRDGGSRQNIGHPIGQGRLKNTLEPTSHDGLSRKHIGQSVIENVQRIEPTGLDPVTIRVSDTIADLTAAAERLAGALHPRTAASLADLVRIMNAYYSNLIEGHNTRPREIERALAGDLAEDESRRNLQIEARAHVRVQAEVDRLSADGQLGEPASPAFALWLHRSFYSEGPAAMLEVKGRDGPYAMRPGEFRAHPFQDVAVGRLITPGSASVASFMKYFERCFTLEPMGRAARLIAFAVAHHRFNYIHPFPDGNGRVSRLMSHAMSHRSGIGAHGLWSISRGLARGLADRTEYKALMDAADAPRYGDLDGRGNLSLSALTEFVAWFLEVALDQVRFMSEQFDLDNLTRRLRRYVERDDRIRREVADLLVEAAIRGEFERGEARRITGLSERSARRAVAESIELGLLASETSKGALSLRFPQHLAEDLFPRLFSPEDARAK